MFEASINFLSVIVATVAAMAIGAIWYQPAVFGKLWMKEVGKTDEDIKGANTGYAISALSTVVAAYVLAHIINYFGIITVIDGVVLAFWLWLGFIVTTMATNYIFESRSWVLFTITVFHHLAALAVMAAIIVLWP